MSKEVLVNLSIKLDLFSQEKMQDLNQETTLVGIDNIDDLMKDWKNIKS